MARCTGCLCLLNSGVCPGCQELEGCCDCEPSDCHPEKGLLPSSQNTGAYCPKCGSVNVRGVTGRWICSVCGPTDQIPPQYRPLAAGQWYSGYDRFGGQRVTSPPLPKVPAGRSKERPKARPFLERAFDIAKAGGTREDMLPRWRLEAREEMERLKERMRALKNKLACPDPPFVPEDEDDG